MTFSASSLIFLFPIERAQPTKGVYKSLKQRVYVGTQDDSFVQCLSPKYLFHNPTKNFVTRKNTLITGYQNVNY